MDDLRRAVAGAMDELFGGSRTGERTSGVLHSGSGRGRRLPAERAEAIRDVRELRIDLGDHAEQATRLDDVA